MSKCFKNEGEQLEYSLEVLVEDLPKQKNWLIMSKNMLILMDIFTCV